jgi:uncharacterized iron-regulated membrane protein
MSLSEETVARSSPPTAPRSRGWRLVILRVHFYAGILVAPLMIVAAITGALYALSPTAERIVYHDLLTVDRGADALPLSEQVTAARTAYPQLEMTGVRPPAADTESTRVYFADPSLGEEELRAVFVDPYDGEVLGSEKTWLGYLPLSTWLDGLHRHLNLGEPGRIYSELAASWLWVVALGGVWLWLVKVRGDRRRGRPGGLLTVGRGVSGRLRTMNWHGATGMWILAMVLFLSATGITWSTYAGAHVTDIRAALNWARPQLDTAAHHDGHPAAVDDLSSIDYDAVVAAAARNGVSVPLEITLPAAPGQSVGVTEIDKPYRLTTDAVALNPTTLSATNAIDYRRDYSIVAKLADWGIRMHMGFLFGLLNQLLLLGVAVALLTVIVRGYLMWWQRRPTRGSQWAIGRPPLRGGIRRLRPATVVVGACVVVAVGWFLPLLGISLAVFLVVDAVIGTVKKRRATAANTA